MSEDVDLGLMENIEAYSPDDLPDDPPAVMKSLLRKQKIDKLVDTFIRWWHEQGCSSEAALSRTYKAIRRSFTTEVELRKRQPTVEDRNRDSASRLILTAGRYDDETRLRMIRAFDEGRFSDVIHIAAAIDMFDRERPNAGKKGPQDPIAVEGAIHLDLDQIVEDLQASKLPKTVEELVRNIPVRSIKDDKGCVGKGFRRIQDGPDDELI